jgi:hypothetical protein
VPLGRRRKGEEGRRKGDGRERRRERRRDAGESAHAGIDRNPDE